MLTPGRLHALSRRDIPRIARRFSAGSGVWTFFNPCLGANGVAHVRLKARLNSRVKVPDLADTVRPVIESNCAGAITPGGEQLEMNEQSVTPSPSMGDKVNSIRSAGLASRHEPGEAHNEIRLPAQREWNATGGGPQMFGDGMFGSSSDVNQGTTTGGERAGRGQSPRSSEEASNDRGAKGGKDVVLG